MTLWSGPYNDTDIAQGSNGQRQQVDIGITRSRMSREGLTESSAAARVEMSGSCSSRGMLCQ